MDRGDKSNAKSKNGYRVGSSCTVTVENDHVDFFPNKPMLKTLKLKLNELIGKTIEEGISSSSKVQNINEAITNEERLENVIVQLERGVSYFKKFYVICLYRLKILNLLRTKWEIRSNESLLCLKFYSV